MYTVESSFPHLGKDNAVKRPAVNRPAVKSTAVKSTAVNRRRSNVAHRTIGTFSVESADPETNILLSGDHAKTNCLIKSPESEY
jgi:hypothetical protein